MTHPDIVRTVAREYLRVSLDKSRRERSPQEQHADNKRAADSRGWTLGEPLRDIGSASRYARKSRAGFDQLIAELEAGTFDANILILWESSRGSRKVGEWANLIELCEDRGVRIFVTADSRLYDPREPRDRRSMLEDAVDSAYESDKLSKRTSRSEAARAIEGRARGMAPFGYRSTYDPATGRFTGWEIDDKEAALVRELFSRLAQGHSLRSISRDWEARGIKTPRGNVFSSQRLRTMALTETYAGIRVHDPDRRSRDIRSESATYSDATMWKAIVPKSRFHAVRRILTSPERRTSRPGRAVHLLSLIAVCDPCGGELSVRNLKSGMAYLCRPKGCITVPYHELNTLVENEIEAYLDRPENLAQLVSRPDDDELERARKAVSDIKEELRDLGRKLGQNRISAELAALAEPDIQARLAAARAVEAELSTPAALAGFIKPGETVRQAWARAPMSARRDVARLVLSPRFLGEVRITRSPLDRQRSSVEGRVVWRRE